MFIHIDIAEAPFKLGFKDGSILNLCCENEKYTFHNFVYIQCFNELLKKCTFEFASLKYGQ